MTEQTKKTYEDKMTDLDAKIKALREQKRKLQKDHEVKDLKLKLKKQSEQIAQLTADNAELKAKLSDIDMSTVAFDPTPKLEKQKEKIEDQAKRLADLAQEKADLSAQLKEQKRLYAIINNRYGRSLWVIKDLSKQYGLDLDPIMVRIKVEPSDESDEKEK